MLRDERFYCRELENFQVVFALFLILDLFQLINVLYVHVVFLIHIQVHLFQHVFVLRFDRVLDDVVHEYLLNMIQVFRQLGYDDQFRYYIMIEY